MTTNFVLLLVEFRIHSLHHMQRIRKEKKRYPMYDTELHLKGMLIYTLVKHGLLFTGY